MYLCILPLCLTFPKKKIRDSRTDETPRPHSRVRVCSWHLSSNGKRLVPSLSHRGILSRQDCTPMKTAHPFSCTPVQLHTHKDTHSFICTPVVKVHHCSCQNVTRLTVLVVNPTDQKFFFRKREKGKAFSCSIKRNLYWFSCSIQYLSSVVVQHVALLNSFTSPCICDPSITIFETDTGVVPDLAVFPSSGCFCIHYREKTERTDVKLDS